MSLLSRVIDTAVNGMFKTLGEGIFELAIMLVTIGQAYLRNKNFWEGAIDLVWVVCIMLAFHIWRAVYVVWREIDRTQPVETESLLYSADNQKSRGFKSPERPKYFQVQLVLIGTVGMLLLFGLAFDAHLVETAHHPQIDGGDTEAKSNQKPRAENKAANTPSPNSAPSAAITRGTLHSRLPSSVKATTHREQYGPPVEPVPFSDPDRTKRLELEKKLFDMNNAGLREYVSSVIRDLRAFDPHWTTPRQAMELDHTPAVDDPNGQQIEQQEEAKRDARMKGYQERYWNAFWATFPFLASIQAEVVNRCPNRVDPTDPSVQAGFNNPNSPGSSALQSADYLENLARKCLN